MRFSLPLITQMFGGSSQVPSIVERCSFVWILLNDLFTMGSVVVGSWEEPPNILIEGSEKRICRLRFEF